MKIPKRVKIAGHNIRIRHRKILKLHGDECYGLTWNAANLIELAEKTKQGRVPKSRKEETLLHEIIHTIADKYGLDMGEKIVKRLAGALYQTLRDNKLDFSD